VEQDCLNAGEKKKNNCIEGKELKWRKGNCEKVLNAIAFEVNKSKKFRNCPIEQDCYGSSKRKV
jgi:hypothetical protein